MSGKQSPKQNLKRRQKAAKNNIEPTPEKPGLSPNFVAYESLCEYGFSFSDGMAGKLSERLESFGYDLSPEEEEKLYDIYKRVARRMFNERYGK